MLRKVCFNGIRVVIMYKQEKKAGAVQYFVSLAAALVLWIICDMLGAMIKNQFASDIAFILAACVLVYFVYTHYCAVFRFELTKKKLIAVRKIGYREYKEEIPLSKIDSVEFGKRKEKLGDKVFGFYVNVFSRKKRCYIHYENKSKCLIFEPNEQLLTLIKESTNG